MSRPVLVEAFPHLQQVWLVEPPVLDLLDFQTRLSRLCREVPFSGESHGAQNEEIEPRNPR